MKYTTEYTFWYFKDLECYANDHLYVDAMDNTDTNYKGPDSQYRQFLVINLFLHGPLKFLYYSLVLF